MNTADYAAKFCKCTRRAPASSSPPSFFIASLYHDALAAIFQRIDNAQLLSPSFSSIVSCHGSSRDSLLPGFDRIAVLSEFIVGLCLKRFGFVSSSRRSWMRFDIMSRYSDGRIVRISSLKRLEVFQDYGHSNHLSNVISRYMLVRLVNVCSVATILAFIFVL